MSGACRSAACALAARASCLPPFFFVVFSPPARRVLPFAGTLLALATAPGCRCVLGRCFLVMTAVLGVGISATASVAFSGETVSVNMPIGAADVIARSSSSSGFMPRSAVQAWSSGANLTIHRFFTSQTPVQKTPKGEPGQTGQSPELHEMSQTVNRPCRLSRRSYTDTCRSTNLNHGQVHVGPGTMRVVLNSSSSSRAGAPDCVCA